MAEILNAIFTILVIAAICVGGGWLLMGNKLGWWGKISPAAPESDKKAAGGGPTEIVKAFFETKVYLTYCGAAGKELFEVALQEGEHYLIGRGADCDLLLPDLSLSAREAFIGRDENGYFLSSLGRNGMYSEKHQRIDELALEAGTDYTVYLGGGPVEIHLSFEAPAQRGSRGHDTAFARRHPVKV